MKAGSKVEVEFINVDGSRGREPATVAITTREMLPLPAGYIPIRFADGQRSLVPSGRVFQPAESDLIAADLALNLAKAAHYERNDARALQDQIMLQTLLRSSL